MDRDVLARLPVKGPRRIAAIGSVGVLAAATLTLGLAEGMLPGARVFLLGPGAVMAWGAWSIIRATEADLVLTRDGISDTAGRVIAPMDNIAAVERGIFAIKPPSGFGVRLNTPMAFAWAPGVWWRVGRKVGIGGAVSGPAAKAMVEVLELALADREGRLPRG